jgi:hypothetical protein
VRTDLDSVCLYEFPHPSAVGRHCRAIDRRDRKRQVPAQEVPSHAWDVGEHDSAGRAAGQALDGRVQRRCQQFFEVQWII